MEIILILIVAAGLGFIPAEIAKNKGKENYWLWWFYGWMLFIVAIIHAMCLEDSSVSKSLTTTTAPYGSADELLKFKELLDKGVITQEEFDAKKKQLIN